MAVLMAKGTECQFTAHICDLVIIRTDAICSKITLGKKLMRPETSAGNCLAGVETIDSINPTIIVRIVFAEVEALIIQPDEGLNHKVR